MVKRLCTIMVAVVLFVCIQTASVFASEMSFTDTSGHWAEEAIASVVEKGLFKGTSETTFSPDVSMNRGMFVTVLGRFAEKAGVEVKGTSTFSDVTPNDYFAPYVAWAAEQGIVRGTSESSFSPADPVTREQMCALFIRLLYYAKYDVPSGTGLSFTDADKISDYALTNVQNAVALGLIKGVETENGLEFRPAASATRAEVATVFIRLDSLDGIYEALSAIEQNNPVLPVGPEPSTPNKPSNDGSGNVTPDPANPANPTNPSELMIPPGTTEEEIAAEAKAVEYMTKMMQQYDEMEYIGTTDDVVQQCMTIITDCVKDALKDRAGGTFLSREYVKQKYSSQIEQAMDLYHTMNDVQLSQLFNVAGRMGTLKELTTVFDYYGFTYSL